MIIKSEAFVIHYFRYKSSSIISKLFTKEYGLQSYIAKGIASKRSNINFSVFQPLVHIEIVANHKEKGGLQILKEANIIGISSVYFSNDLQKNILKKSIFVFVSELLNKILKENHRDIQLFDFLNSLHSYINKKDKISPNISIFILLNILKIMGIIDYKGIENNRIKNNKLRNDIFTLLKSSFDEIDKLNITKFNRQKIFNYSLNILKYNNLLKENLNSPALLHKLLS